MSDFISTQAIERRGKWIEKIKSIDGAFAENALFLEQEIQNEVEREGVQVLHDHLRLCGNIPESYEHDSSEEKLYSKYTDALLCVAYKHIGLKSNVLAERAGVADVDAFGKDFSFVADAKAFRLSRTAKNQKDFKVQAMDGWKHGKPFAMVVCPIYQLPSRNSQIYHQAIGRNVCIFTYSHLSLLLKVAQAYGQNKARKLLLEVFQTIPALIPSKSAIDYWLAVNKTILKSHKGVDKLWREEKMASSESVEIGKKEALIFLASEREKIMRMTLDEAIKELMRANKIDSKIRVIQSVSDNGLFSVT